MENNVSRRSFVAGTAAAAGAAAISMAGASASAYATEESTESEVWDREAEIVVCGYGGAGSIAAIAAYDNGADVLVIEKEPADTEDTINHTPSIRMAYTAMMNFNDKQGAIDYLTAVSRGATPDDVIESWAEYSTDCASYLYGLGATEEQLVDAGASMTEYDTDLLPEGDNYTCYHFPDQGPEMWNFLDGCVQDRGIEVLYETPMTSLVTDEEGAVTGVVAETTEGTIRIKASKAVILACGGFEYNDDMLNQYIWGYPTRYYANPGNTGDGIQAAQAVGADLWHMTLVGGRVIPYFPDLGYGLQYGTPSPFVLVDKYGKRFMNESWKSHSAVWEDFYYDTDLMDFPAIPCLSVFDQTAIDSGPVVRSGMLLLDQYEWSDDNSVEIEKGWIYKGETIEELVEVICEDSDFEGKLDATTLEETIENFNSYCENGEDLEFGRDTNDLIPLSTPPYYALKMYPGGVNTFGGPRRNAKGQIVRPDGTAITGLYGAGEMGSVLGFLYSGGGWNVCECVVSGRLAADNAVQETAR